MTPASKPLLPCPCYWCGTETEVVKTGIGHSTGFLVQCPNCYAKGPSVNLTQADAITAWNICPAAPSQPPMTVQQAFDTLSQPPRFAPVATDVNYLPPSVDGQIKCIKHGYIDCHFCDGSFSPMASQPPSVEALEPQQCPVCTYGRKEYSDAFVCHKQGCTEYLKAAPKPRPPVEEKQKTLTERRMARSSLVANPPSVEPPALSRELDNPKGV